jgi:hypothetical protein
VCRLLLTAALLICTPQPASGAVPAGTAPDSGISGQVRLDGSCGIRETRCSSRRVAATVVIRTRDTHRRVRTLHPRGGRFHARLRPGRYTVRATSERAAGAARRDVVVRPHRFTVVVLRLHSPVRAPPRPPGGRSA